MSQLEKTANQIEISAPIRIRRAISFHHFMNFRILYQIARHRNARNNGYMRRDRTCQNRTKLDAHPGPKNGEPVVT